MAATTSRPRRVSAAEQLARVALERDQARRDRVVWRRYAFEALDMLAELDAAADADELRRAVLRAKERAAEIFADVGASSRTG